MHFYEVRISTKSKVDASQTGKGVYSAHTTSLLTL